MVTTVTATAKAIEAARIKRGMSRVELSETSGIARSTLNRLLDGHAAWNVDQIARAGHALGVDPTNLVKFRAVAS